MIKRMFKRWNGVRTLRENEQGGALVELALSMPLLTLILMGGVEMAKVAYASIEVSNAASAAVQYGALKSANTSDYSCSGTYPSSTCTGGIANAAVNDAANLNGIVVTSVALACSCANTAYTPTSCTDNSTCSTHNTSMISTLTVTTKAPYTSLFRFSGDRGSSAYNLYGKASQTVSNQ